MVSAPTDLTSVQERAGVRFCDKDLLRTALTHPSYANEHPEEDAGTNERLEFLGDAVLGLIVAADLYDRFPEEGEGRLTEWRARLVMGTTLARVARSLGLGDGLRLGRGEESTGGREREGNLARVYESVLGALLLDRGLDVARGFVLRTLAADMEAIAAGDAVLNPKGELQQLLQRESARPEYETVASEGPEHDRRFTVEVRIDGQVAGAGHGATKQDAEKAAAAAALEWLRSENAQRNPAET